jgi:hypothetical protein
LLSLSRGETANPGRPRTAVAEAAHAIGLEAAARRGT